jgi:hypothetical protein
MKSYTILQQQNNKIMTDYQLKKLQEKRLSMLQNGFYYLTIALGTFVVLLYTLLFIIKFSILIIK